MSVLQIRLPNGEVREKKFDGKVPLLELLPDMPYAPALPCGGHGKCGKCLAFAEGDLDPAPRNGVIYICRTFVFGDAILYYPPKQEMCEIETGGIFPEYRLAPMSTGYGAAVDIGTTTVVLSLYDLSTGTLLCSLGAENQQSVFAADVIGRIEASLSGKGFLLREMIRGQIDRMESSACETAGIQKEQVRSKVVTGNTTMLYLYSGYSPETLSRAPFIADHLFGCFEKEEYLPPCFGAFVGADISCAVLASSMMESGETCMLVDIGTNGEIALWHDGRLLCCATAAGPAFEGYGVECGSQSTAGAISEVYTDENGSIVFRTIGGEEPVTVCGSGLIDAVAAFLDTGILDETGAIDGDRIRITDRVYISQKDIRQFQLAKAAICAGILSLLEYAGISTEDVKRFCIAGGFGRHLNITSAVKTGLIPECFSGIAEIIGNAALSGASTLLLDSGKREEIENLYKKCECINLASTSYFSDKFIDCMMLEPV